MSEIFTTRIEDVTIEGQPEQMIFGETINKGTRERLTLKWYYEPDMRDYGLKGIHVSLKSAILECIIRSGTSSREMEYKIDLLEWEFTKEYRGNYNFDLHPKRIELNFNTNKLHLIF